MEAAEYAISAVVKTSRPFLGHLEKFLKTNFDNFVVENHPDLLNNIAASRNIQGTIMKAKASELVRIAQELADITPEFHAIKGPGLGDQATGKFIKALRARALEIFGQGCSEQRISGETKFTVDFWFPDEKTVVEFAFDIRNASGSEFYKDIFKVLLAIDGGRNIENLLFVSKPGAIRRHSEPASKAITEWLERNYGVKITIVELKA